MIISTDDDGEELIDEFQVIRIVQFDEREKGRVDKKINDGEGNPIMVIMPRICEVIRSKLLVSYNFLM